MMEIAVIIGCSHVNDLGLMRSLGEAKIPFVFIKVGVGDEYGVMKCKYLKKNRIISVSSYEELLPVLQDIGRSQGKKYIICTNDLAAEFVDNNESGLSESFITPARGGTIGAYFDKIVQCKLAEKCGLVVPKSVVFHRGTDIKSINLKFPLLTKPLESAKGSKNDIHICWNQSDLIKYVSIDSACDNFIIQEFIEKDCEINTLGVRTEHGVIWGCSIRKIRHYPYPTGPGSFARVLTPQECGVNTEGIESFLEHVGYYGLFSAEFVMKDNTNYFMEVNLRNDGLCYASTCAGMNLPATYVNYEEQRDCNSFRAVNMMNLYLDVKNLLLGKVKPLIWFDQFIHTKAFIDYNRRDILPAFIYLFNIIKRQLS